MKKTLLACTALAFLAMAEVSHAASGAWTLISTDAIAREKVYGISGTTDLQLPPLTPDMKNSRVEMVVTIASSSVVVTPTQVLVSSSAPINNPSGTIPGTATLRSNATLGATGSVVADVLRSPKVGANVDVSDTGALWTLYAKVKAPAKKSFANK